MIIKKMIAVLVFFFGSIIGIQDIYAASLSKPLKIMFIVNYFPAPSQPYILNMITALIDKGHDVSIFSFHKKRVKEEDPDIVKYSLYEKIIYEKFSEILPEVDIVFCQSASVGKQIIEMDNLSDWLKERKLVVCLRGSDIASNKVNQNPHLYDNLFQKANLILPVCNYFKQLAINLGCDENKLIVYHSAINCKKFFFAERSLKSKEETIHFISVGRLVEKKGFSFSIEAIAKIARKYNNIHFTIIGSGYLRLRLEKLVESLQIKDKITFLGWKPQDDIIKLLNQSHIFLLPSLTASNGNEEGIANALKEAMAMGLISIGSYHAGTPELIEDGVSGFLVPPANSIALAEKLEYIIQNPQLWQSIGKAGRKKIEDEFEIKKCIDQLEKIFFELL